MILDNPFRRLGLTATASPRDVRRRIEELTVRASLGTAPELPADELSRLRQALEDPVQRARHEIFWLHSPAEVVDPRLDVTSANGSLGTTIETLRAEAGGSQSARQAIALHDLAVLSYARFLHMGTGADPGDALLLWASVLESKPFWEHMRERAAEAAEARLTSQVVEQIKDEIPQALLDPLAARAAAQVDAEEFDAAAASVRFIRRSGLQSAAIDAAARRAIAPLRAKIEAGATAVEKLIEAIPASEGATAETERRLRETERSLIESVLVPMVLLRKVDPVLSDEAVGDRAAEAVRRVSVAVCNLLEEWGWGYALVRESMEMARTPSYLAQLAGEQALVCSNYHYGAATDAAKLQRPDLAAAHYELALPYARSEEQRASLRNMATGARSHGRVSEAQVDAQKAQIISALERRQNALKAAVAEAVTRPSGAETDADELAAAIWRAPPQRTPLCSGSRRRPHEAVATFPVADVEPTYRCPTCGREHRIARAAAPRKSRRRWWIIAVGAASLIAIAIAIAATHASSSSSSGAGTPPDAAAVTTDAPPAGEGSPDCSEVPVLSDEIDNLDTQIAANRRLVSRLDAQIRPIEVQINQIIRDYPSKQLPTDVWNRFVPLRTQYKALVARSNKAVRDGNALIRLHNSKLKKYRRLNAEC